MWRVIRIAVFWGAAALLVCGAQFVHAESRRSAAIKIGQGSFTPFYGIGKYKGEIAIPSFFLDRYLVTNAHFVAFLRAHPEWTPKNIPRIMAEGTYLQHWQKDKDGRRPRTGDNKKPVTYVSWFAAAQFCAAAGGRLPRLSEWEYVAQASETDKNAARDPTIVSRLLVWYERPSDSLSDVGQSKPNAWGIYDMHGLVWEWVDDFNSVVIDEGDKKAFCGAGSLDAADKANYAAFLRYAFRNSLQGAYAMKSLGFRCAYDLPKETS